MATIGRLELLWRPGSWRHIDEWVFARQFCPQGCLVLDVGFFVFTWKRGRHHDDCGPCGECGNDHGGHSQDCHELDCAICGHGMVAHLGGTESCSESGCSCEEYERMASLRSPIREARS